MLIGRIREWLLDPDVAAAEVDGLDHAMANRSVLIRKPLVGKLFQRFYRQCRDFDRRYFGAAQGSRLEIGSGSSRFGETFSDVITSDVQMLPWLDIVLDARQMPFPDGSLRAIYGINVFHHLSDPRRFLREMIRVISPGGGLVLIEPYHGPLARVLFRRLHSSEGFEPDVKTWDMSDSIGPMSGANQALSYVVFTRDRATFLREFPELELVKDYPHTHVWYLASGGVNFRQLVPDSFVGVLSAMERLLSPFDKWIALQHTIVLRKRPLHR
jgi:SAM-dependent methyltransferase